VAKSRKLEETLALLSQFLEEPTSEEAVSTLGQVLKSKYAVAVAKAAKMVSEADIYQLFPALVAAFDRFMINPEATDPNCIAKTGIARAFIAWSLARKASSSKASGMYSC